MKLRRAPARTAALADGFYLEWCGRLATADLQEKPMNLYYLAAIWLGMALLASLLSTRLALPVALAEIFIGAFAGNLPGIKEHLSDATFVPLLASAGGLALTFLAGSEIDPASLRKHWVSAGAIGVVSFAGPFLAGFAFCSWALHWPLHSSELGGV